MSDKSNTNSDSSDKIKIGRIQFANCEHSIHELEKLYPPLTGKGLKLLRENIIDEVLELIDEALLEWQHSPVGAKEFVKQLKRKIKKLC